MDRVSDALKYFINLKITTDKSYKDLKIILSDSSVPGSSNKSKFFFR
jgi:5'-3' exoribonuclease 2